MPDYLTEKLTSPLFLHWQISFHMQNDSLNVLVDSLTQPQIIVNTDSSVQEEIPSVAESESLKIPEAKEEVLTPVEVVRKETIKSLDASNESSEILVEKDAFVSKKVELSKPLNLFSTIHSDDSSIVNLSAEPIEFFTVKGVNEQQEVVYRHDKMKSEKTWVFGLVVFVLALVLIVQIFYKKHFTTILNSLVNMQLSDKLMREKNVLVKRLFFILNLIYLLGLGLYFYHLAEKIGFTSLPFNSFSFFLLIFFGVSGIVFFRMIVNYLTALVFDARDVFREYLHNSYIINKNLGISLLPVMGSTFFVVPAIADFLFILGTILVILAILIRYLKATQIILRHNVFLFYSILYLCTLEILPVLIGVKFVLTLR